MNNKRSWKDYKIKAGWSSGNMLDSKKIRWDKKSKTVNYNKNFCWNGFVTIPLKKC